MLDYQETTSGTNKQSKRGSKMQPADYDLVSYLQTEFSLAELQRKREERKSRAFWRRVARFWPVFAGVVAGCFAPQIREWIAPFAPWGMRVVFPFVEIASLSDLYPNHAVIGIIPTALLYAQFALEGLLARSLLKDRVTFWGVMGQVLFFHFLGFTLLWLVNGGLNQLVGR